ncbi:uncharacterized protein ASPGLDRAFT_704096 [Aspergillus glaucus CBS 516.65]|uniref:Uncharacterized protein n=1 Tax=Aspergillus glaucus CBS 516.65 TaxID=1160497 RepID=A0A1L9VWX6_ASPGL|nr:hypothetical protein ASPGLDRAFT_704096 [Aspergillus glaucus CBS 516.65]OJJ88414.1 hypothetical protein ASPGLDRAFT_704096 [Aspergillus glaucus CBS 516.65]
MGKDKTPSIGEQHGEDEQPGEIITKDQDVDPALKMTGGTVVEFTPEEEKQVLTKIDLHMLPLMCWVLR